MRGLKMGEKEKIGITKMGIVIIIAAVIVIASVATAGWWFFLRPVEKKTSTIDLAFLSPEVPNGENQNVSGLIKPAVADATVTLIVTKPDGSTFNATVTSSADGSFTYSFPVDIEGNWTVTASWPGNNKFKAAESTLKTFTVVAALAPGKSLIGCSVLPSEVEGGGDVTLFGKIWTSPAGAGAGATVTLTITPPGGTPFTRTVTAKSDSSFTYTYTLVETDPIGWWEVTASWLGTVEVEGDISYVTKFHMLPVLDTVHPIKFGVIGPMQWVQGAGMKQAGQLAAEQINEAGGILGRKVVIKTGDEGSLPAEGVPEMTRLCVDEKVHFVLGGFRTEITDPMREVAMNNRIIYIICGSATTELIDCRETLAYPCHRCVYCDYPRYKYLFRATPTNSNILFSGYLVPYMKEYLIPNILKPKYGSVKVAAIVENLAWTYQLRYMIDTAPDFVFGEAKLVYKAYVSPLATDFSAQLSAIKSSGAQLIFESFSGEEGLAFIKQWGFSQIPAVPVGINVLSQMSEVWKMTGGKCEYEAILATSGTRTPVTTKNVEFWDAYVERWGESPIYTSYGVYDAIMGIAEMINEKAALDHPELKDPDTWEAMYEDRTLYDILIPYMEKMKRDGTLGQTAYTSSHDILTGGYYAEDRGLEYYVKPLLCQWQDGEMVVVSAGKNSYTQPAWAPYVVDFKLPPWM